MSHDSMADQWLPKRWYVLALRDDIPLPPEGWTVYVHRQTCVTQGSQPICTPVSCGGISCRFLRFEGADPRFALGLRDLAMTVDDMLGRPADDGLNLAGTELPVGRAVVVVGGAFLPAEEPHLHFDRSFGLARDAVKALRLATLAPVRNLTIERVWPLYLMLSEPEPGDLVPALVVVEHGFRGTPATDQLQLDAAQTLLMAGWQRHPAEMYRDFELSAQNAAWVEGDYPAAILTAATAAELLIKHTAWVLTWEAVSHLDPDPSAPRGGFDPFTAKPSALIGNVLQPRLRGDWGSRQDTRPIGAWRTCIAQLRNSVIHRGHRPSANEIASTLHALNGLEKHISDRVAAAADTYPRSAMILVGYEGLASRGALAKVDVIANDPSQSPETQLAAYNRWLDSGLAAAKDLD